MSTLNGKVAVVTGASKGIGAGIAKGLAAAGASVVVNYASSREGADRVVDEILSKGGMAIAVHGDVSKSADVLRLFEETKARFGQVDVLVNNAGVFKFEPIEAVTEAEFQRQYAINVLGPLLTIQRALNYFPTTGGSIINISSIVGENPLPHASVYSSTKAAVDAITKSLAKELGPRGIRVNTVAPGGTETEGTVTSGIVGSDMEKVMIAQTPLGRLGQPADIAPAVVFLASDASAWITGEKIGVSGGLR